MLFLGLIICFSACKKEDEVIEDEPVIEGVWTTYNMDNGLPNNHVNDLAIDNDGNIWCALIGGDIAKFDGENWESYNRGVWSVTAVAVDKDNKKWFGKRNSAQYPSNNVNAFDDNNWESYSLAAIPVFDIAIDGNNNKWFGMGEGAVKYNGDTWENYFNEPFNGSSVYSVAIDGNNIWFGTSQRSPAPDSTIGFTGVVKLSDGDWTIYTNNDGLVDSPIHTIAIDANGSKYFGSNSKGVSKFDGANWTTYNTENGLVDNAIRTIIVDKKNNLWIGTTDGVSMYNGAKWRTYTVEDGLSHNWVTSIVIDDEGKMWFGTNGGGITVYSDE